MSRPSSSHASSDRSKVEAVVRGYIDAWYAGDVDLMNRVLHDDLVKRTPGAEDADLLREVPKARMMQLTADGGGDASDPSMEIDVDDVATDIAAARVVSPEYVDYLHLVKTSAGWKIANVLFRIRG